MRKRETMTFDRPQFNAGVNVTVRYDKKWSRSGAIYINLGGGHTHGPVVPYAREVTFSTLTDLDLINQHDPDCRTVEGLFTVMKKAHAEFTKDDTVVVVSFILPHTIPQINDMVFGPDMVPYCRGQISEVIPLNDDFYEICWENSKGMDDRAVVHSANYLNDIIDGNDGWFIVKTYRHP